MEEVPLNQQPYSTKFEHLADLKAYVGKELGLTDWMTISQERIDNFAYATEDFQWIHINPEMARQHSPYKTTVAHGFLVLSLASKFTYEAYSIADSTLGINYGLDKVRFPNATPAGAQIRGRVSLIEFKEIPGGARFKLKINFELKDDSKPACVAEFIAQVYADPALTAESEAKPFLIPPSVKKQTVGYEKEGKVALITLNRPDRYNAVTDQLIDELNQAIRKARKDDEVRAVVLTGAGRGFCGGADLATFSTSDTPEEKREYIINKYGTLIRNLVSLRKPIIGAINGSAAGVGCAIALACDLRIMADNGSLRYAFINIGLGPDGGASWFLVRQVGYARAFQIAVEGEKLPAAKCLELGLTNKVVPADQLLAEARMWAAQLAERPTFAVGITKLDLNYALNHDVHETLVFEATGQAEAFKTYDLQEGVAAFLQKRKPKFIGR